VRHTCRVIERQIEYEREQRRDILGERRFEDRRALKGKENRDGDGEISLISKSVGRKRFPTGTGCYTKGFGNPL